MKVAIIQCDSVTPTLRTEFGDYDDMIKHMFESAKADLDFQVFNAQQPEYPEKIDDFDFFITTGSKSGAYEGDNWIKQLIRFVQMLDEQRKKLIGICFGHQIIAMARHGMVEKSSKGWGVGVATTRIIARPGWMKAPPDELNIIVSHQDQITQLPADTLVIASNDFCPYFVVQWGEHFLSIQGHPEWQRDYSKALMSLRRDMLGTERFESGIASLDTEPDNELFTQWILDFVRH